VREKLEDSYSHTGRPSIDPELLLRILLIGYLYGMTSERKLVEELRRHLAWRWFTGLGFDQEIPHHSTPQLPLRSCNIQFVEQRERWAGSITFYFRSLATVENTLFAFPPIKRIAPMTTTRITASITAYSAISWPSSFNQTPCMISNIAPSQMAQLFHS
jgi:Transposase domain (DUF772)